VTPRICGDAESAGPGKDQRHHVDPEHGDAGGLAPGAFDGVAYPTGSTRLCRVEGHDKRKGDHAQGGEQDGEGADGSRERGDNAQEQGDIDEEANRKALADELEEADVLAAGIGYPPGGLHDDRIATVLLFH